MISALFFLLFILLCLCIVSILSFMASNNEKKVDLVKKINVVDGFLISAIKDVYFSFVHNLYYSNFDELQKICSEDFYQSIENSVKIDKNKVLVNRVLVILSCEVVSFDGFIMNLKILSRGINSEILYNDVVMFLREINNITLIRIDRVS